MIYKGTSSKKKVAEAMIVRLMVVRPEVGITKRNAAGTVRRGITKNGITTTPNKKLRLGRI